MGRRNNSRFGVIRLNGAIGNTVAQSQELKLSTTLNIDREINGFDLLCFLEDMQGREIFRLRQVSPDLGIKHVRMGRYSIGLTVPPLWLNLELYSIYFKVFVWGEQDSTQRVSDKFPLDVEGLGSRSDSILNPDVDWSIRLETLAADACSTVHEPARWVPRSVFLPR